jgi:LPS-assembly protein
VISEQSSVNSKKYKRLSLVILLFTIHYSLFTIHCFAEEQTIITSETLEYNEGTSTYTAKGNVKIQRADTTIESDEVAYNEQTSEIFAGGVIRYNDPDVSITSRKAELNLGSNTGILYDAEILFKKDNYHIAGKIIEKKGERYYFSPEATFTTCDAPVPAWCFRGKNIDAVIGERLKAKNVSFRIKDVPVLYTPYLRTSFQTERQTGFLMPEIGFGKKNGLNVNIPFYLAISENRDATVTMDTYTKRGIGEGLEYRYIESHNIDGQWWLYHIRDRELDTDFVELKALHEQRFTDGFSDFLKINYVNEKNFYREFNPYAELRTNRFLESTGEISFPLTNSRIYLLSQYWIDLKENSISAPQKLPEVGYILNTTNVGHFYFSATAAATNFWRDEGVYGRRLDIYPRMFHEFGRDVVISQTIGFRETAYSLDRSEDNSLNREAFEYRIVANTRLLRRYESFTHILEPSVGYTLITDSESPYLFDTTELFKKTSTIELSLLNRFVDKNGELMVFRASQGYDSYLKDRQFLPFKLEVGIKRPVSVRLDASYDVNVGKLDSINSDIRMKVFDTTVTAGQRYNRDNDITFYNAGIGLYPYKPLYMEGKLWYDAKEKEIRDITVKIKYESQCWAMNMVFVKKPGDFIVSIMFDLMNIGSRRSKDNI